MFLLSRLSLERSSPKKALKVISLFLSSTLFGGNKDFRVDAFSPNSVCAPARNNLWTKVTQPVLDTSHIFQQKWSPVKHHYHHPTNSFHTLGTQLNSDSPKFYSDENLVDFRRGDKIQVEVTRFGYLGASVDVIAHLSHDEKDLIPESEPPLGMGLILQKEIQYFRDARDGLDVVTGEILPAYIEKVRDDGKLNISLRVPGGKGKAEDLATTVLEKLKSSNDGSLPIGDKSTPGEISRIFPGASKASFKRAVAFLYKKGLVLPGTNSINLMN